MMKDYILCEKAIKEYIEKKEFSNNPHLIINFKKLTPSAKTPKKAHSIDACFDLYCTRYEINEGLLIYHTDIAIEIPIGYIGLCFQRSSIAKTGLILSNCVGVIDPGYTGEIIWKYRKISDEPIYSVGDRIGQITIIKNTIIKLNEVTEFAGTERGSNGFGSTGK